MEWFQKLVVLEFTLPLVGKLLQQHAPLSWVLHVLRVSLARLYLLHMSSHMLCRSSSSSYMCFKKNCEWFSRMQVWTFFFFKFCIVARLSHGGGGQGHFLEDTNGILVTSAAPLYCLQECPSPCRILDDLCQISNPLPSVGWFITAFSSEDMWFEWFVRICDLRSFVAAILNMLSKMRVNE